MAYNVFVQEIEERISKMLTDYCRNTRDDELSVYTARNGFSFWLKQVHDGYVDLSKHRSRARALTFAYANEYSVYCSDNCPLDAETCARYPYILAVHEDNADGEPELLRVFAYTKKGEAQEAAQDIMAETADYEDVCVESIGFVLSNVCSVKDAYADCTHWVVCAEDDNIREDTHIHGGIELAFSVFVGAACEWGGNTVLYAEDACTGAKETVEEFVVNDDGCCLYLS